jgi:hypothetical protein
MDRRSRATGHEPPQFSAYGMQHGTIPASDLAFSLPARAATEPLAQRVATGEAAMPRWSNLRQKPLLLPPIEALHYFKIVADSGCQI